MKITLDANEYMDIMIMDDGTATIEFGKFHLLNEAEEVFRRIGDIGMPFEMITNAFGYDISNVMNEIISYMDSKEESYIRIKRDKLKKLTYSIVSWNEYVYNSDDFMDLVNNEILKQENNASL